MPLLLTKQEHLINKNQRNQKRTMVLTKIACLIIFKTQTNKIRVNNVPNLSAQFTISNQDKP